MARQSPHRRRKNPRTSTARTSTAAVVIPQGAVWLTPAQAGIYTQIHPETLKEKARRGVLPASKVHRVGGRRGSWRFRISDLDRFIVNGGARDVA